jgi:hypothetical protein
VVHATLRDGPAQGFASDGMMQMMPTGHSGIRVQTQTAGRKQEHPGRLTEGIRILSPQGIWQRGANTLSIINFLNVYGTGHRCFNFSLKR